MREVFENVLVKIIIGRCGTMTSLLQSLYTVSGARSNGPLSLIADSLCDTIVAKSLDAIQGLKTSFNIDGKDKETDSLIRIWLEYDFWLCLLEVPSNSKTMKSITLQNVKAAFDVVDEVVAI